MDALGEGEESGSVTREGCSPNGTEEWIPIGGILERVRRPGRLLIGSSESLARNEQSESVRRLLEVRKRN